MCAGILDDSPVECNKHVAVELFKFSEDLKRVCLGERGVIRMKCLCSLSPQWRGVTSILTVVDLGVGGSQKIDLFCVRH